MDGEEERNGNGAEAFEVTDLNLAYRFLDSLPNDVHVLNNLPDPLKIIRINLAGNHIPVLPDSIGMFLNLREMDISANGLAYITPRIGELRHLRTLIAKNNNLVDLPKEFARLVALENLNLSGNGFESFMPQMFELVSLKTLFFGGNRVDVIPPDIQSLQRWVFYVNTKRISLPRVNWLCRTKCATIFANHYMEKINRKFTIRVFFFFLSKQSLKLISVNIVPYEKYFLSVRSHYLADA